MGMYVYNSSPPVFRNAAAAQRRAFNRNQARSAGTFSVHRAGNFLDPACQILVVNPTYETNTPSPMDSIMRVLAVGAVLAAAYKVVQAISDEDYPGNSVPPRVRQEMIRDHVSWWGCTCPNCGRNTRDLQIDHIVPRAQDGRNSRGNLQVLCRRCNLKKGTKCSLWDEFLGRYADN